MFHQPIICPSKTTASPWIRKEPFLDNPALWAPKTWFFEQVQLKDVWLRMNWSSTPVTTTVLLPKQRETTEGGHFDISSERGTDEEQGWPWSLKGVMSTVGSLGAGTSHLCCVPFKGKAYDRMWLHLMTTQSLLPSFVYFFSCNVIWNCWFCIHFA